jgi:hypothetical protein
MNIRFISSLTAEDEDQFAPAVLKAVSALLDQLPIAYTMRIETAGSRVFSILMSWPGHIEEGGFESRSDSFSGPLDPCGIRSDAGE